MNKEELIEENKRLDDILEELNTRRDKFGKQGKGFSQESIYDQIDKFGAVQTQIKASKTSDIALQDAMESIGKVASALDNPNIDPRERKALAVHLDTAELQLKSGNRDALNDKSKKEYDASKKVITKQIKNFREIVDKGTSNKGLAGQFMDERKAKAGKWLTGVLTANPIIGVLHDSYTAWKDVKQSQEESASEAMSNTDRAHISKLEEEATAIRDAKKARKKTFFKKTESQKKKDKEKSTAEKKQKSSNKKASTATKAKKEPVSKSTAEPVSGGSSTVSEAVSSGGDGMDTGLIHDDLQELISVNTSMVEVLREIEQDSEKRTDLEEKAQLHAQENKLEADRKNKECEGKSGMFGGMFGSTKNKLKGMKDGFMSKMGDLAEIGTFFNTFKFKSLFKPFKALGKLGAGVIGKGVGVVGKLVSTVGKGAGVIGKGVGAVGSMIGKGGGMLKGAMGGLSKGGGMGSAMRMGKSFAKPVLKGVKGAAVIGASGKAAYDAFNAWQDSEGKALTGRIADTAQAYGDSILGMFGTSGGELATKLLDASMDDVADEQSKSGDKLTSAAVESMSKYGETKGAFNVDDEGKVTVDDEDAVVKMPTSVLNSVLKMSDKNADADTKEIVKSAMRMREAGYESEDDAEKKSKVQIEKLNQDKKTKGIVSTEEGIFGDSVNVDKKRLGELDVAVLRSLLEAPDLTDESRKSITNYLAEKGELVPKSTVESRRKDAGIEPNTKRATQKQLEVANATTNDRAEGGASGAKATVVNNVTNNNDSKVINAKESAGGEVNNRASARYM